MGRKNIKIKGLKEFQRKLDNMAKAAEELNGENQVAFTELFTDSFLRTNTKFSSFDDFSSREIFSKYPDLKSIPNDEIDQFVSLNSRFSSWEEMLNKASETCIAKRLGF